MDDFLLLDVLLHAVGWVLGLNQMIWTDDVLWWRRVAKTYLGTNYFQASA